MGENVSSMTLTMFFIGLQGELKKKSQLSMSISSKKDQAANHMGLCGLSLIMNLIHGQTLDTHKRKVAILAKAIIFSRIRTFP